jgi:hypothetical protein
MLRWVFRWLEVVTASFKVLVILKITAIWLGMPAVLHGSTETWMELLGTSVTHSRYLDCKSHVADSGSRLNDDREVVCEDMGRAKIWFLRGCILLVYLLISGAVIEYNHNKSNYWVSNGKDVEGSCGPAWGRPAIPAFAGGAGENLAEAQDSLQPEIRARYLQNMTFVWTILECGVTQWMNIMRQLSCVYWDVTGCDPVDKYGRFRQKAVSLRNNAKYLCRTESKRGG